MEGRTLLPVRAICEAVGANVSFDNETRTVTAKGYDYTLVLKIGDNSIKLYIGSDDFLESQCDVLPMIIDGGRSFRSAHFARRLILRFRGTRKQRPSLQSRRFSPKRMRTEA